MIKQPLHPLIHFTSTFIIAAALLFSPSPSIGGQQATLAVSAVKKMVESGEIPAHAVIRLVAKQGNIDNFWGKDFALKNEWERSTGTLIDATVMPQLPVLEFLRSHQDLDLTVARQHEYPDLRTEGLIVDLTGFVQRFGFHMDENPATGFIRLACQSEFNGKIVAIPADGDIAMLYLRRDLMEAPENREKFQQKYHRRLRPPATWDEYQDLIEFFHDAKRGFYGTCEQRDPQTGYMFWMPRYASQAAPNQFLFDDHMHPLINSAAGVAATESYVKTVAFSPPHILDEGNHYNYTVPIYRRGDAFAYLNTMANAKMLNLESSPVKGKFVCALMPGTVTGGKLVRRTSFIYGNNIVISSSSPHKELAFLYAMWITDPDISTASIAVTTGISDPYRFNHLKDARIQSIYTRQALDSLAQHAKIAVPEGTGLPGDHEYLAALSKHLWAAAKGELTARQAMERTAAQWEKITERLGRNDQIRYWRAFKKKFPQIVFPVPSSN